MIRLQTAAIRLDTNHTELRRLATDRGHALVTDTTRRTLNRAIILTPVNTGNLRAHNQMIIDVRRQQVVGHVVNNAEYADVVHNGSGPYIIRPRRAKALRFTTGGRVVYTRQVRHPGTRARPWIARAAEEVAIPAGFIWTPT